MKYHMAVYLTESNGLNRYKEFCSSAKQGKVEGWVGRKTFDRGDIVLFYFGQDVKSIIAIGKVSSEPWVEEGSFTWTDKPKETFCNFQPVLLFKDNPLNLPEAASNSTLIDKWYKGNSWRSTRKVSKQVALVLIAAIVADNLWIQPKLKKLGISVNDKLSNKTASLQKKYKDGAVRQITLEMRYRNRSFRESVIEKKGCNCEVCGFNFKDKYGDIGTGYIEVHHLKPLSKTNKAGTIFSVKDVAVVCPNCHRMLHRHGVEPIKLAELRRKIKLQN